jgi:hypothetical protein
MPDLSGRDLLHEWRRVVDGLMEQAASGSERVLPRQLLEPMQRQLELMQEIVERERALQKELAGRIAAPVDAVFDLLLESAAMMQRQAEAIDAAGRALEDTASLMKAQADLFERTVQTMRQPTELAKAAAGVERRPKR